MAGACECDNEPSASVAVMCSVLVSSEALAAV